jgi:hypothetical protein
VHAADDLVVRGLLLGECCALGLLVRVADRGREADISQVGQSRDLVFGLVELERGQQVFRFLRAGGVVFPAGAYVRDPAGEAVGIRQYLDVAAMTLVFAATPVS